MANNESRKLMVDVVARIDKLEKAMKRGAQVTDQQMGKVEKRARTMVVRLNSEFAGIGKAFASGLAGGIFAAGISGAVSGLQNIIKETANLRAEAARAGVSLTAFQQWKAVAEDTRIPLDAMVDALKELNIRADEFATTGKGSAAEAFGRLGMTPDEVQKKLADPSKLMQEIIDKTKALNNQAAATRIFDEVFGGTGAEQAVRLLDLADGSIQKIMKSAQDADRILDETMIKRAEEIDREFNTLWNNFEASAKTAILNISIALKDGLAKDMGNIAAYAKDLWNDPNVQNLNKFLWGDGNDMRVAGAHGPATASDPALVEAARRKYGRQPTEITVTPPSKSSKKTSGGGSSRKSEVDEALRQAEAVKALIKDLEFEKSLVGKSALEQEKMTTLRQAGSAATAEQRARIQELVESTYRQTEAYDAQQQQLAELNDLGREFAGTLVSGFLSGAKATDVLTDAIGRLADRFLNSGLDALFSGSGIGGIFKGIFGGGANLDPWAGMRGYDKGGYTGAGHRLAPAGVVHKGEVVWSQNDVRRAGGVGTVEAMRRGVRGYDVGGAPGMATLKAPSMPTLQAAQQPKEIRVQPQINISIAANGDETIRAIVSDGVSQGLRQYDKSGPMRFARDSKQASRRGLVR